MQALLRRPVVIAMFTLCGLLASLAPASAQGFGVGARVAWVNADTEADVDSVRYFGGQVRFMSGRIGFELSMDRHSESLEAVDRKVTETPLQASLILKGTSKLAPYLLGGPGWYRRTVEALDGPSDLDIRYTFLDFGDDDDDDDGGGIIGGGIIGGLLPGHRGSMWTLGATVYF